MELARVEGTVVSTMKADRLRGYKLLVVNLLKPDTTETGSHVVPSMKGVLARVSKIVLGE